MMTMTTMPTRRQIDAAEPLDMTTTRSEKQCNITVELAPDGVHVRAEYTGGLSTIPAVIERLKSLGVVELVSAAKPAATSPASPQRTKSAKVAPEYNDAGEACCPKHGKVLKEGNYGLYCSAKDDTSERGFCSIKFAE